MATNNHVYQIAQQIKQAIVDHYALRGANLPSDQFVAEGEVAWDCEELVVQTVRAFPGSAGADLTGARVPCNYPHAAEFAVWLVRCSAPMHEDGSAPTPDEQSASAEVFLTDLWLLIEGLKLGAADGSFGVDCDDITVGEVIRHGPQGGFAATEVRVVVGIGTF